MKYKVIFFTVLLLLAVAPFTYGQSNKEKAYTKGMEAIKLMDSGKIDEGIKLMEEAQKLDPESFDYPYEVAYGYALKEDYPKAIKILEANAKHKNVNDRLYQLMGNCYSLQGNTEDAFKAYDKGLKIFPNSGIIYLEKGNVHWGKKEYEKAMSYYEKGIEVEPSFPSNYYRAALIYCNSTEEVWGMMYGEIFMNLERNSKRTGEISKLLFDTYKSAIQFANPEGTEYSVSFSQSAMIDISKISDPSKVKLPFGVGVYEPTIMMAIVGEKNIDLSSLNRIRTRFVEQYFSNKVTKTFPNLLFDYQNKIMKAGHMEAYNHWLLMQGDSDGFNKWQSANKDKWDNFVKWFTDNSLKVDASNKFYSGQF